MLRRGIGSGYYNPNSSGTQQTAEWHDSSLPGHSLSIRDKSYQAIPKSSRSLITHNRPSQEQETMHHKNLMKPNDIHIYININITITYPYGIQELSHFHLLTLSQHLEGVLHIYCRPSCHPLRSPLQDSSGPLQRVCNPSSPLRIAQHGSANSRAENGKLAVRLCPLSFVREVPRGNRIIHRGLRLTLIVMAE